jgi:hypothetical protein
VIELLWNAIRAHGWHVVAELALFVLILIFSAFYVVALVRGRVRAVVCASCGRLASRAHRRCPRCDQPLPSPG